MATIEELLKSLQTPATSKSSKLTGSVAEIYERIGKKDSFGELGLTDSELDDFLKEWVSENPYNAM